MNKEWRRNADLHAWSLAMTMVSYEAAFEKGAVSAAKPVDGEWSSTFVPYINTPRGAAIQYPSTEALSALEAVKSGSPLYREGLTGFQTTGGAQFWSLSNPASTPGYSGLMGMPTGGSAGEAPWMMGGQLNPGAPVITRPAPGIGKNLGGGMEAVVNPGGVQINWATVGSNGRIPIDPD